MVLLLGMDKALQPGNKVVQPGMHMALLLSKDMNKDKLLEMLEYRLLMRQW